MTDKAKRMECVKQEIRSVLLTQPNGLTIAALLSDYRNMVGQHLPFREFGYSVPDDFLRSIPQVVSMNWSPRYNTYVLKAVADETTKHIEKLVSKQKTSKTSTIATRRMLSSVPPRFNRGPSTRSAPRSLFLPVSVKNEIYNVAKEFKSGLSFPNFLTAYRRKYGKDLIYKNFGFYTLEDCLKNIPELLLRCENEELRVYPIIEKRTEQNIAPVYPDSWRPNQNASSNCNNVNQENRSVNKTSVTSNVSFVPFSDKPKENKTMDVLDNFSCQDEQSNRFGISSALREQFKQIMKKYPQGVWVSEFPEALWKYSGNSLDHCKLGYINLVDLFNDLPEIFRIEVINGCKDDWMLFDATSPGESFRLKGGSEVRPSGRKPSTDSFEVIKNIRLLLQANYEGVYFDEFCSLYEANCDERFSLSEFGFDSLPIFLETIAEKVPLQIDYSGKQPRVFYKKEETSRAISNRMSPRLELPPDVPSDAVVRCTEYKLQKFPDDRNTDQFCPVYLSAVVDPSHIYIQLRSTDTSLPLENLMDEMEIFYYNRDSERYRIPSHCIMSGIVCAAVWPSDGRWHRVRISSVPTNTTVVAFFVDYGTKERIPSDNLRFLRQKFMELPAQAIRSHLCRLKPYPEDCWDPRARDLILNSFGRQPLMACLTVRPEESESLSLVLCDVSKENDVFLNDLLVSEGFAKYETDELSILNHEEPVSDSHFREELISPVNNQKSEVSPHQPQAPVLPGNATGNLLQMMSLINAQPMKSHDAQNPSNPILNLLNNFGHVDPASLQYPWLLKQLQALGVNNIFSKPATSSQTQPAARNPEPNFSPTSAGYYGPSAPVNSQRIPHESDSEVFESDEDVDDDDSPEVNSISKRYVKRLNLDDGYSHVHMIVIDDRPYMSSGDITFLLWSHDDPNFVRRKLKSKEISIPNNTVNEVGYEQLFYQLGRFQVKGVKTEPTGSSYITLFPFKNVIDILNIFGHPSVAVRDIIDNELLHFDPSDSFWKTISEEEFEENPVRIETPDDRQQKLCLYELKASLQALKFRRQTLKNQLYSSASIPNLGDEIERIETQCAEVERRIRELQVKVVSHQREGFD